MSYYKETDIDRKNRQWFKNNLTCNTLLKIGVNQSSIRGLGQFSMEFNYPITVIAGENGCGKSTILSLISCAFHNNNLSFCPMSLLSNTKKQRTYYTYSDFFAFTSEERGFLRDIQIKSTFLTDRPRNTDIRSKSPRKGQWKDYDTITSINRYLEGIRVLLEEFDHSKKAIIDPEMVVTKLNDFPEVTISCFSKH